MKAFRTPSRADKQRLVVLGIFLFVLFSALITQFFRVQIVEGAMWRKKAEAQHYLYVVEPFQRGTFWANNEVKLGHPEKAQKLAIDIRRYHLHIDPAALGDAHREALAEELAIRARIAPKDLATYTAQFYRTRSRSRRLAKWLDEETKQSIHSWWKGWSKARKLPPNAVFFVPDYLRTHPFGRLLGQVLHTVQQHRDESSGQAYPTGGLELSCHRFLAGKNGLRRLMRSPRHRMETQEVLAAPKDGADVFLTVNHCLQAICEEEIERGVKIAQAKAGWAVMMDPYTGAILALAQYPFFYPDQYPLYFGRKELAEHAKVKAITDAYEPGSTMKPITVAIALMANKEMKRQGKNEIFHPLEKIDTSKGNFPGRGKKPLTDTNFHHYLNMYLALQKSSNIYCATLVGRIVQRCGDSWYRNQLAETFGFGQKVGIELPGESAGLLPTPGKKHPNGRLEWSLSTPYSLAMGHNMQATSVQMLCAYSAIANGGYLVTPTLIKRVASRSGRVLLDNTTPERIQSFPHVLDADVIREVVRGMRLVTRKGGASAVADIWGFTEAGKSGTSMKVDGGAYSAKHHFSTFIGFAPASKPAFVLLIAIDEPKPGFIPGKGFNQRGATCAAPIFREAGRRALEYMCIPLDDPYGYPKGDPRHDPSKTEGFAEGEKMRLLYEQWNRKTL